MQLSAKSNKAECNKTRNACNNNNKIKIVKYDVIITIDKQLFKLIYK